jgi:integrase
MLWGEIFLESAAPEIGAEWTDSRERSETRGLKHREPGTGRTVPCSPELTAILHRHLAKHGTAPDGRLFWGTRGGGRLPSSVYGRVWAKAREAAFTPEVVASPLAKRPYDLRHAAVSTWLNAGVEATRVAEWAGHSVAVLLRVYAKCLDGGEQAARAKVQQAMTG